MTGRRRYGPDRGEAAAQVVLNDPRYCLWWLAERPESALADAFRGLIADVDQRRLTRACTGCGRRADLTHAVEGCAELIPYCRPCSALREGAGPVQRIVSYEDAVRHVVRTFPRGHRIFMRRIVKRLVELKGGPSRLTEAAVARWLGGGAPAQTDLLAAARVGSWP